MFNRHRLVSCQSTTPTPEKDGNGKSLGAYFTTTYHNLKILEILVKAETFEWKRMKAPNSQVKQEIPVVFGQDIKYDIGLKYCCYCFIKPRLGRAGRRRSKKEKKILTLIIFMLLHRWGKFKR